MRETESKQDLRTILREARWTLRSWMVNDPKRDVASARLLAGSGRSGTTWLQEVACRAGQLRPVFEPFHSQRDAMFAAVPHGTYVASDVVDSELQRKTAYVFSGAYRSPWSDQLGSVTPSHAARGRLVKDIRVLPWLGWISANFPQVQIAHVIRHPLAVVQSSTDLGWKPDFYERLIGQEGFVATHLVNHRDFLASLGSDWERSLAGWCIENIVAIRETSHQSNVALFSYEQLVAERSEVRRYLAHFGIAGDGDIGLDRASRMSRPGGATAGSYATPYWREQLTGEQVAAAQRVLERFGLDRAFAIDGEVRLSELQSAV